jgi:hypothetical protein
MPSPQHVQAKCRIHLQLATVFCRDGLQSASASSTRGRVRGQKYRGGRREALAKASFFADFCELERSDAHLRRIDSHWHATCNT